MVDLNIFFTEKYLKKKKFLKTTKLKYRCSKYILIFEVVLNDKYLMLNTMTI